MPSIGAAAPLTGGGRSPRLGPSQARAVLGSRLRPPKRRRPRLSDGVCFRFPPLGVNGSRAVAVARLSAGRPRRLGPGVSRARLPVVSPSRCLRYARRVSVRRSVWVSADGVRSLFSPAGVGSNRARESRPRAGHAGGKPVVRAQQRKGVGRKEKGRVRSGREGCSGRGFRGGGVGSGEGSGSPRPSLPSPPVRTVFPCPSPLALGFPAR